ncbi:MAG TPA: thioesterase family protein [Gaiellaceae bacterium]|nr:thioesterase family protein [Gaiellaceae bacterium]
MARGRTRRLPGRACRRLSGDPRRGVEALTTEVCLRYHRAAYFDERLRIWTRCTDLRGARFTYEYRIERDCELVADGHTCHATVERETYRPTRVPTWLAEAVAKAESAAE